LWYSGVYGIKIWHPDPTPGRQISTNQKAKHRHPVDIEHLQHPEFKTVLSVAALIGLDHHGNRNTGMAVAPAAPVEWDSGFEPAIRSGTVEGRTVSIVKQVSSISAPKSEGVLLGCFLEDSWLHSV
jgi:hypothetical protein